MAIVGMEFLRIVRNCDRESRMTREQNRKCTAYVTKSVLRMSACPTRADLPSSKRSRIVCRRLLYLRTCTVKASLFFSRHLPQAWSPSTSQRVLPRYFQHSSVAPHLERFDPPPVGWTNGQSVAFIQQQSIFVKRLRMSILLE